MNCPQLEFEFRWQLLLCKQYIYKLDCVNFVDNFCGLFAIVAMKLGNSFFYWFTRGKLPIHQSMREASITFDSMVLIDLQMRESTFEYIEW